MMRLKILIWLKNVIVNMIAKRIVAMAFALEEKTQTEEMIAKTSAKKRTTKNE